MIVKYKCWYCDEVIFVDTEHLFPDNAKETFAVSGFILPDRINVSNARCGHNHFMKVGVTVLEGGTNGNSRDADS